MPHVDGYVTNERQLCIEDCDELYDTLGDCMVNGISRFLDMICLAINYHLVMKKIYRLALKFDYFAIAQYRALHLKEINIV